MNVSPDRRQSTLINALRFPLVVLVLISHCILVENIGESLTGLDGVTLLTLTNRFARSLGHVSVACFALISGYFFYYKVNQWTAGGYITDVKKRIGSLALPYLVWNLLAIGILWAKNTLALKIGFAPGYSEYEYYLVTNSRILDLVLLPIDGSLWYIRELFYITLVSPLIYLIIRYLKGWGILLLLGVNHLLLPNLMIDGTMAFNFVFGNIGIHFTLGAFLGFYKINMLETFRSYRAFLYVGALSYFAIRTLDCPSWADSLLPIATTCFALSALLFAEQVLEWKPRWVERAVSWAPMTFFVYAIHCIVIINLVRGSLYQTPLANSDLGESLIVWLTALGALALSIIAYRISHKLFPRLTSFLSGGRG